MNLAETMLSAGTLRDSDVKATAAQWEQNGPQTHRVHFYSDEKFLLEGLTRTIGGALLAGDSAIVIATKAIRDRLAKQLKKGGMDLAPVMREGRYVSLDAAATLKKFMVDGWPQAARFAGAMGDLLKKARQAAEGERPRVIVFGEMVRLLWAEGNRGAALRLEQLWNVVAETHRFHLYCAYPMNLFSQTADGEGIAKVCAQHTSAVPAESYTSSLSDAEHSRSIISLQQKAQALETEILERKKAERELQAREAELRDFLENAVIGMHWVDANGVILWANKAELDLLGYAPEEYVGHHISEFYADKAQIEDILQRLQRHEALKGYEARMKAKDGSIRDVRVDSNVATKDGQFTHTRCFTIDITEQKQAEEARMRLAAIVECSEDGIASKDLNGIVTSWNAAAERIFGYKAEEMIGRPITTIIPPELHPDEDVILGKIRRGERIEHFQTVRQTKAGDRIDVSLTVSPVKDKHGNVIGAAKIVRDITQQKRLERALHTTERLASVGRLAATVAHEINNPLESVTNFIYLAKTSPGLSEDLRRYLNCADQELARVAHIARQTLGFYRDNSRPVWLSVSEAVDDILAIYQRKFEYKGLKVEKCIAAGLKFQTLEGEFKQILSNLLANAIDACEDRGRVWLRARAGRDFGNGKRGMRLLVADNGSGIPPEHLGKLFEPFFTTKREVGTGLGLWITKELIEKSGGHIRLRSRVGSSSGTVVSVFMPLEPETPAGLVA
jgi:PAS domain S-box-containing protein